MALTVAFFVKPPTLPVSNESCSGKLTAYAVDVATPMNRPHLLEAGSWRTRTEPMMLKTRFHDIHSVRLFLKYVAPAALMITSTSWTSPARAPRRRVWKTVNLKLRMTIAANYTIC